ncbi:uncharacterized protein OCT59_001500 [Rhizophagus irregularis]|uniref:uncharacterized protein n=1 Tax=Rhizophagus irregularis TaxID=588596 RepID=UPI000CBDF004|nr:hypothetical protein OCT59_001500 [Rhizophagus irregularis]
MSNPNPRWNYKQTGKLLVPESFCSQFINNDFQICKMISYRRRVSISVNEIKEIPQPSIWHNIIISNIPNKFSIRFFY